MRLAVILLFPLFACIVPDPGLVDDTGAPADSDDTDLVDDTDDTDDTDVLPTDADEDGFSVAEGDCDDFNPAINPDQVELCDDVDNNCDLAVDEGLKTSSWYPDLDLDGYGDPLALATLDCAAPPGAVSNADDCDDTDAAYNPGVIEKDCTDPIDYNCDGSVGWADDDEDSFAACEDCDDINPDVNDDAVETCNGIDDNCDGATDGPDSEGQSTWYADADGDGAGDPESTTDACDVPLGYVAGASDCDDRDASVILRTWYADADGDRYGDAGSTVEACDAPRGYVADGTDCDDTDASVGSDGGAGSGSETFDYTGDVQTLTVTGCMREVTIEAYGAEGVQATTTRSTPGLGGMARGTLAVSPGDVLYIYVGGNDGYNGGGDSWTGSANTCNGGGASDVRLGGIELTDRVIVAGGGGGVSGESAWGNGGDGGGGTCDTNYCGGQRGYGYGFSAGDGGLTGGTSGSNEHGGPGGGGGYTSGGAGARATGYGGALAGSGTFGAGGDGAGSPSGCCGSYGLAGGGGGYYGGGGVAGGCCGGGGAGGGSSWTGGLTSPDFEPGVQSGDGQVVISW